MRQLIVVLQKKNNMKTILLSVTAFLVFGSMNAQNTSFENAEGYSLGEINGQNGWQVSSFFSSMFTIVDGPFSNGQNSLKLGLETTGFLPSGSVIGPARNISAQVPLNPDTYEVSADLYFTSTTATQTEVDFYVYGAAGIEALPSSIMALANGFVRIIEMSNLTTAAEVVVPNDVFTNLRVKFDFQNQQTFYYVNNVLAYTGPLNLSKVTGYGFYTTGKNICYVDNVKAGTNLLNVSDVAQNRFSHFVSQNQLSITSPSTMSDIEIYSITGQKVISQSLNSTNGTIEIGSLSSGIYLAKLNFQGATKTFKFVR